jgi:hypothetical protein
LKPAASAKFYPLLLELIKCGEKTAMVTLGFSCKQEVTNMFKKATQLTPFLTSHGTRGRIEEFASLGHR